MPSAVRVEQCSHIIWIVLFNELINTCMKGIKIVSWLPLVYQVQNNSITYTLVSKAVIQLTNYIIFWIKTILLWSVTWLLLQTILIVCDLFFLKTSKLYLLKGTRACMHKKTAGYSVNDDDISRLHHFAPCSTLIYIYNSLMLAVFNSHHRMGSCWKMVYIEKILELQKRALRSIFSAHYLFHTIPYFHRASTCQWISCTSNRYITKNVRCFKQGIVTPNILSFSPSRDLSRQRTSS